MLESKSKYYKEAGEAEKANLHLTKAERMNKKALKEAKAMELYRGIEKANSEEPRSKDQPTKTVIYPIINSMQIFSSLNVLQSKIRL